MRGELLIDAPIDEVIVRYARNAREAGLDGVVCSPLEAGMVKQACGAEFLTVTPGVRFADGDMGDQVRVTTPGACPRDRLRLHRRGASRHGGVRSRGGLSPLRGRIRRCGMKYAGCGTTTAFPIRKIDES